MAPARELKRAGAAVMLTGVGKRYDIVSAFAQHAQVVAADPNPLAPAQYAAATIATRFPRSTPPGTCRSCAHCASATAWPW